MFTKTIASAIIASVLGAGVPATAHAFGGGGGEGPSFMSTTFPDGSRASVRGDANGRTVIKRKKDRVSIRRINRRDENVPSIIMHNPDGTTTEVRGTRNGRRITTRGNGKVEARELPKRGTSWAHNHTTGVTSVGVAPGVHIVIGPLGIGLGF